MSHISFFNNMWFDAAPIPEPPGSFEIHLNLIKNRVEAYKGSKKVEIGVIFHSMNKSVSINAKTGQFTVNYPGTATIRGILGDKHVDITHEFS